MKKPQVWMYGGGRQSACIAALIIQGKLPTPDYAVIANTPAEFEAACVLDEQIRAIDPCAFLHHSCVPLRQANLDSKKDANQCELGVCFV